VDEYRRSKRRATVPLDEASLLFAGEDNEAALARRDLGKLLDKLPEAKRALVSAVKLDGDSIAEIAARTGMSESAVKVNVHRALKSLSDDVVERDENR
jgi:RNA polymerase sigma-70 factor (ECF subfamily)